MISVQSENMLMAVKAAYGALLTEPANGSDTTILHESAAAIELMESAAVPGGFRIIDGKFVYENEYTAYFPEVDPALIAEEERDYSRLFLTSGEFRTIVQHLRQHPDSRRAIISSWSPVYLDPAKVGVCIVQLYFRLRNGQLEVHSHGRANDAYRLLLLDMQLARCMQVEVAAELGVAVGRLVHFVDSLHFYKKYADNVARQWQYMQTAAVWQPGDV